MFVLHDIAAFDRIRISGLMASQVEALVGGLDALARLKASKQVAEYLAQSGVIWSSAPTACCAWSWTRCLCMATCPLSKPSWPSAPTAPRACRRSTMTSCGTSAVTRRKPYCRRAEPGGASIITTHHTMLIRCGAFVAYWDEDKNVPPVFSGNWNAAEYFKAYMAATRSNAPMAAFWHLRRWSRTS